MPDRQFCSARMTVESDDGDVYDLRCSKEAGHPEDHRDVIWWSASTEGTDQK